MSPAQDLLDPEVGHSYLVTMMQVIPTLLIAMTIGDHFRRTRATDEPIAPSVYVMHASISIAGFFSASGGVLGIIDQYLAVLATSASAFMTLTLILAAPVNVLVPIGPNAPKVPFSIRRDLPYSVIFIVGGGAGLLFMLLLATTTA